MVSENDLMPLAVRFAKWCGDDFVTEEQLLHALWIVAWSLAMDDQLRYDFMAMVEEIIQELRNGKVDKRWLRRK